MAQELVTLVWCDVHMERGERVAGAPWSLLVLGPDDPPSTHGRTARTVDLCDECAADLGLKVVSEVVDAHGRDAGKLRPSRSRSTAARTAPDGGEFWPCPECDKSYDSRPKLAAHGREAHNRSIAELLGEPAPHVCPVCSASYGVPQALAVHMTRKHPDAERPRTSPRGG